MFPDLVPVTNMTSVEYGNGYIVGKVKQPISSLTRANELTGKFEGLNTLLEYQAKNMKTAKHTKASNRKPDRDRKFHAFDSFNAAIDIYKNNPSSISEFIEHDGAINGGESSGLEIMYDVTGDTLDVGRFLSGEPEVFGSLTNGNPRNKRVNILVSLTWWWRVNQDAINTRAKRIIRLVDWLESQSIRTQVIGIESGQCCHIEVLVKHFDEPLNTSDIAVIGHSDFLRRVMFRFIEYSDTYESDYGRADSFSHYMRDHMNSFASEYNDEITLLIDGCMNEDIDNINKQFNQIETKLVGALEDENAETRVLKVL